VDVTIAVGTFGDASWPALAASRAIPSAEQFGCPIVHVHADTLHDARNQALDLVDTEWVIHLDADDELEPGYIDAMAAATADLRAPAVRYMQGRVPDPLRIPKVAGHQHDCTADCLTEGNWLVIGTAVRADLVRRVGGWRDYAWSEDWDLWVRCWLAGATVEAVPDAIYRAHVRHNSRNRGASRDIRNACHRAIHEANFGASV
jgi:GT2 family glycosyltransferase